jgi:hypothetical protein
MGHPWNVIQYCEDGGPVASEASHGGYLPARPGVSSPEGRLSPWASNSALARAFSIRIHFNLLGRHVFLFFW